MARTRHDSPVRAVLVRTLVFFALVALPTMVFDLVYWSRELPWALLTPSEVALRLTAVALATTIVERRLARRWMPAVVFLVAAVVYALGYVESEYLNGMLLGHSADAGMQALLEHGRHLLRKPRHFALLYALVASPFAIASTARVARLALPAATAVSTFTTLVVAILVLEPFRTEIGRVMAAFVCVRTIFVGLMLPLTGHLADRYEARRLIQHDST